MIRPYIPHLTALLVTLVVFMLAFGITEPTLAEAKRKPIRAPTPAPVQLPAPTLLSPPNSATVSGQVNFVWSAVPGAARYHLQAAPNPYHDAQFNIIDQWGLTDTSYPFYASPDFMVYFPHLYWRVQAIDANDFQGSWSEIWYFNFTSP
jgi:hypothetical protein